MSPAAKDRLKDWANFSDEVKQQLVLGDLSALWSALDEVVERQEADKKDTNDRLGKVTAAFIGLIITLAAAALSAWFASKGAQ